MYKLRLSMTGLLLGYPLNVVDLRRSESLDVGFQKVDGILMPGGVDIDPAMYVDSLPREIGTYIRENAHLADLTPEGKERDTFESAVLKKYTSDESYSKLPLLGICRGMQMMTVMEKIPMYLDIKTELGIKNRRYMFDRVSIEPDSLMSSIYKKTSISGYKLHHQGLRVPFYLENKELYPNVKVTAFSNDRKIAEAIEYQHRPALGVQYHPEMSFSTTTFPILKWFLKKSCDYKTSQKVAL